MPQESNALAGMTPAFMNQPQYQQQMQGLAMQVRQQEEGTKKIKKFLKAYEDIQLSAPMQAPQQPGFMGGNQMSNQEQGFYQPPGGSARSMNNTLPQNDMTEPAPTSFTEMAGGSVPPEPTYEEAPIGEEEAMGGVPSQGEPIRPRLDHGTYPEHYKDSPGDSEYVKRFKQDLRKKYDATPLEQRGIPADAEGRQEYLKRNNEIQKNIDKGNAENKQHGSRSWIRDQIKSIQEHVDRITRVIRKGTETSIETDPRTGKTYPIAGYSKEEVKSAKSQEKDAKAKLANAKKIEAAADAKLKKIRDSKPNKAMGIAGLATGLLAGTGQAGAVAFPPEDAEIFLGRIHKDRDFQKLNAREKAAVQKYLEYKAESDSMSGRSGIPRSRSDEPIEYSSAEKALMSQ